MEQFETVVYERSYLYETMNIQAKKNFLKPLCLGEIMHFLSENMRFNRFLQSFTLQKYNYLKIELEFIYILNHYGNQTSISSNIRF